MAIITPEPVPLYPEDEQEKDTFDIDKALNKKAFVEFLAKHPDAESFDMNDAEEVEKRFETFGMVENVSARLKKLYSGKISEEFGIKLDKNDLECIDIHLSEVAIENPDELTNVLGQLEAYEIMPGQIKAVEQEFENLTGGKSVQEYQLELEEMHAHRKNIETATGSMGLIGGTKLKLSYLGNMFQQVADRFDKHLGGNVSQKNIAETLKKSGENEDKLEAVKKVKEKHGKVGGMELKYILQKTNKDIEAMEHFVTTAANMNQAREALEDLLSKSKNQLFEGMADIKGFQEVIRSKIEKQFNSMMKGGGADKMEKVHERLARLREISETTELGVDPLEGIDDQGLQERIDEVLELRVTQEIEDALNGTRMGENALTKLEKSLEPLLKRDKMGTKEGDEIRDFLVESLEEAAKKLGNDAEARAKRILVSRIISKFQNN